MSQYRIAGLSAPQADSIRNILLLFDPEAHLGCDARTTLAFEVSADPDAGNREIVVQATLTATGNEPLSENLCDREILDPRYNLADYRQRVRESACMAAFRLMERHTRRAASPWGTLTGIRPAKKYHYLVEKGFTDREARQRLMDVYGVSGANADRIGEIAAVQEPWLNVPPDSIGLYVGIPFCPTRCAYCSFASYPLETHSRFIPGFFEALLAETAAVRQLLQRLALKVDTIYVGGGTPTVLPETLFTALMEALGSGFGSARLREFTVEAGRPDTFSLAVLAAMAGNGVTRTSVNPQTMNQCTLEKIGRCHEVRQVAQAVEWVRQAGIPVLNMDLIIGLPGESVPMVESTLRAIENFRPENMTVHTLAPKRASDWGIKPDTDSSPDDEEVGEMAAVCEASARSAGLRPYYLYRQRRIRANLENIGYARPGTESPYNIQMIEERQTILGLGGGGVTRVVHRDTRRVERLFNPKCPATYASRIQELIDRKVKTIEGLFH